MAKAATMREAKTEGLDVAPVIMRSLNDLRLASEAPKGANLVVRNSSRGSPMTDAELRASIYNKGIIHPLMVKTHDAGLYVVAGNRRLKMLREIFAGAENSRLAQQIQTQNVEDFEGDWREIAIDTNLSLPPHLVERYEVIVSLATDLELSPEDTRLRFGMTPRQYDQVMALGKMSSTVREAWKNGDIDAKTAQTFTLEPDPKEQDRIYQAVKKNAYRGIVNVHEVKQKIVPPNQREVGRLVAFVGLEACKAAKIIKREDLFSSDHVVSDIKALKKMADEKLSRKCDELNAAGWKWALSSDALEGNRYTYSSIKPATEARGNKTETVAIEDLQRRMQILEEAEDFTAAGELEDAIERMQEEIKQRGFTTEQRAKAGCILEISHDGALSVEYGCVKPGERKKVEASERKKPKPKKAGEEAPLTNALAERLSEQLQKAGAEALKNDHAVATAAIIAAISSGGHVLDIRAGHGAVSTKPTAVFGDVFAGALKSTPQQREAMFAQIASRALSVMVHSAQAKSPIEDEAVADLFEAMNGPRVTSAISSAFDAADYFASVSMSMVVDAVKCSIGAEHAAKVAKMKKADAAKFAAANVPGTGWLPKQLRTVWYKGPIESAPEKKAADKAPAKKAAKPAKKAAKKKAKK